MASDWQGIRKVAIRLKETEETDLGKKECLNRSALSRYYYSAFHRARDWAEDQTTPPFPKEAILDAEGKPLSTHQKLWWWLSDTTGLNAFFLQGQEQGHKNRAWADYVLKDKRGKFFDQAKFDELWGKIFDLHRLLSELDNRPWPWDEDGRNKFRSDLKAKIDSIWNSEPSGPEQ